MRTTGAIAAAFSVLAILAAPAAAGQRADKGDGPVASSSIIAGQVADPAQWGFAAALFQDGRLNCGASVIGLYKVLTAAHCVDDVEPDRLAVAVGKADLMSADEGMVLPVRSVASNPNWIFRRSNDVAVITLAEGAFGVQPVTLADAAQTRALTKPGMAVRVAGWGSQNPKGGQLSSVLKTTTEWIRSNRRCRKVYGRLFRRSNMICSLGRKLNRRYGKVPAHSSACFGDSGGPLIADSPTGPLQVGTVSFGGRICGYERAPSVYSRISGSLPFIQENLPLDAG